LAITGKLFNRFGDKKGHYRFVDQSLCEDCLFFEIDPVNITESSKCIICGVVYAPPERSPYVNLDIYKQIEASLLLWDDVHTVLMGDFNARTASLADYVTDETNDNGCVPMANVIDSLNIQKDRSSLDKVKNRHGESLIAFCIGQSLLIVNGRVDRDANVGKLTCKDASLVDYVICSPELFGRLNDFFVSDFHECMSDVHCPLFFSISDSLKMQSNSSSNISNSGIDHSTEKEHVKPIWKTECKESFLEAINENEVNGICDSISDLIASGVDVTQSDIDNITHALGQTMIVPAKTLELFKNCSQKKRKNTTRGDQKTSSNYAWFGRECKNKRANYRKCKKRNKNRNSTATSTARNKSYKEYKKVINKNFGNYINDLQKNVRKLRTENTKTFWDLLNNASKQKQPEGNLPEGDAFVNHFDHLGNVSESEILEGHFTAENLENAKLNEPISEEELDKYFSKLKNNKASGVDQVSNDFLKCAQPKIKKAICLLFNLVLRTGKVPEVWSVGVICPIYKGKGNTRDVDNYRGITILSCLGKLFTSVLNGRINGFLEENNLLGQEQAGFRSGYSTTDHVFSLHCLVDLYRQRKERLFCAFIDYRKAFDKVQQNLLWDKLINTGICGNVLTVIKDMYLKAKSCVKTNAGLSKYFSCNIGVRQGENLSPVLFALFLNDLKKFLHERVQGLNLPSSLANENDSLDIDLYMCLFLLMYADDTIVLAETEEDMQTALNALEVYCHNNGLHINTSKTKIVVFSRGKIRILPKFTFKQDQVEVIFQYKYLGTVFNYDNRFTQARKAQVTLANKAMFALLRKCRKLHLPIDIQLDLFEKCIYPIMLYGCEVWAHENMEVCERLQLKFIKLLLKLRISTPTCMTLGEVGMFPVSLDAKCRMLAFWYKLSVCNKPGKISVRMLQLCTALYNKSDSKLPWLCGVHSMLDSLGLSYIWYNPKDCGYTVDMFKNVVKERMKDQFLQRWQQELMESSSCLNYRLFKHNFQFERYLIDLPPDYSNSFLRFRVLNHRLPIQRLRYQKIERSLRVCDLCASGEIGDEFHYLFNCQYPQLKDKRNALLPKHYLHHVNILKMHSLMNIKSKKKILKLCRLVKFILSLFK
jgi:hypothetical protein